jgi:hypothetical protein
LNNSSAGVIEGAYPQLDAVQAAWCRCGATEVFSADI